MSLACEFPRREMEEEAPQRETAAANDAAGEEPQDSLWFETLSEPELDLLIGWKELSATMATTAVAVKKIHLRRLRALGTVLLGTLKGGLEETSVNPNIVDRLALLSDVHFPNNNGTDPNSDVNEEDHHPTPIPAGVNGERNNMQDNGSHTGKVHQGEKKRKLDELR